MQSNSKPGGWGEHVKYFILKGIIPQSLKLTKECIQEEILLKFNFLMWGKDMECDNSPLSVTLFFPKQVYKYRMGEKIFSSSMSFQ